MKTPNIWWTLKCAKKETQQLLFTLLIFIEKLRQILILAKIAHKKKMTLKTAKVEINFMGRFKSC